MNRMKCHYLPRRPGPAPLWHLAICPDCRKQRRTDALIGFALSCRKAEPVPNGVLAMTLTSLDLPYSLPRRFPIEALVKRVKRPLLALAVLASVLMVAYLRYIDIDPNVVIPGPVFEGPNAADDFAHAYALLQEKELISKMVRPGKLGYGEGSYSDPRYGESGRRGSSDRAKQRSPYSLTEREAVLRKNAESFAWIEHGLFHKYWLKTMAQDSDFYIFQSRVSDLDRLLRLDAETAEDRGEWERAARRGLDIVELGVQLHSTTGMAGMEYGYQHEVIGRNILWQTVDHLSSAEARAATLRLDRISARRPSAVAALEDEKRMTIAHFQWMMRETNWRFRVGSSNSFTSAVLGYLGTLPYSRARILGMVSHHFDREIERSRQVFVPNSQSTPYDLGDSGPLRVYLPSYGGARYMNDLDGVKDGLLITAFALRAYKVDHGSYPESLERLKDGYLRTVPLDPYNSSRPLKYRRTARGYLLYSVGSDCIDSGGTPPVRQPAGTGDIVAGTSSA